MSQKYIKSQNKNSHNVKTFGKYYAKPVYDEKFVVHQITEQEFAQCEDIR